MTDLALFANAGVDSGVSITLHMREPDDEYVSILFGKERITLEFYDIESLELLRDRVDEGLRRLRAALEMAVSGGAAPLGDASAGPGSEAGAVRHGERA